MTQNTPKVHAALVIACLALALSTYTVIRGPKDAGAAGPSVCIDREARGQMDRLRQVMAERDALIARLARTANAASGSTAAGEPAAPQTTPPEPGPRRYTHFQTPNPAVSVTQNADGSYDIRTTDPALAGSVIQVTAVTESGDEDKVMVRIPQ